MSIFARWAVVLLSATLTTAAAQTPFPATAKPTPGEHPPEVPPAAPWRDGGPPSLVDALRPHRESAVVGGYLGSGEFVLDAEDLRVPGVGLDFVFARRYRSRALGASSLGVGWDHSYNIFVVRTGGTLVLHDGNGRADRLRPVASGGYAAPHLFVTAQIEASGAVTVEFPGGGRWELRALDGAPAAGRLAAIIDRNGNRLTMSYDAQGRLSTVTDTLGRVHHYGYAANGLLSDVTDHAGRRVTFGRYLPGDPSGAPNDLRSVTTPAVVGTPNGNDFPLGKTTTYAYSVGQPHVELDHNLLAVVAPDGTTVMRNTHATTAVSADSEFDRIERQELGAAGDAIVVTYEALPASSNPPLPPRTVARVNDRVGNVSEHVFDAQLRLVTLHRFSGRSIPGVPVTATSNRPTAKLRALDPSVFTTEYEYANDWLVTRLVRPEADSVELEYARSDANPLARCNLVRRTRFPGPRGASQVSLTEQWTYTAAHQAIASHVDARGNVTAHSYDARGNRTRTTYRDGATIEDWEYDAQGRLTAHVLPADRTGFRRRDTRTYYGAGHPAQGLLREHVVDAEGVGALAYTTTFEYDAALHLSRRLDPRGGDWLFDVNALGQVQRVRRPLLAAPAGPVRYETTMWYDARDRLVRRDELDVDADGNVLGTLTTATIWLDRWEDLESEVSREVATGAVERQGFEYDANGARTAVVSERALAGVQPGDRVLTSFDERGLLFRRTLAPNAPNRSTLQFDYDGNRNITSILRGIEVGPRVHRLERDGYDRVVAEVDAQGNRCEREYDANGNLLSEVGFGELVDVPGGAGNVRLDEASSTFDALDRRISTARAFFDPASQLPYAPSSAVEAIEYDRLGGILAITDATGSRVDYDYDRIHRLRTISDARGNQTLGEYDAHGNVTRIEEIHVDDTGAPSVTAVSTATYDALDRVVSESTPSGGTRTRKYASRSSSPAVEVDERGNLQARIFDGLGRCVEESRHLRAGGSGGGQLLSILRTEYAWTQGRLLGTVVDDDGNVTRLTHDDAQRLVRIDHPDGTWEEFEHDAYADVSALVDRNGTRTNALYDGLARLVRRTVVAQAPSVVLDTTYEAFEYDGRSRLVRAENDESLVQRSYDSLGAMRWEALTIDRISQPTTGVVHVTTNAAGAATGIVYPGGRTIDVTRDALQRPRRLTIAGVGDLVIDFLGPRRVARTVAPNGAVTTRSFDAALRPTGTTTVGGQAGQAVTLEQRTLSWGVGEFLEDSTDMLPLGVTSDYERDSLGRIVRTTQTGPTAGVTSYTLSDVGDRMAVTGGAFAGTYTMNCAVPTPGDCQMHQYTTTGHDTRAYDAAGNLVLRDPPGPALERFGYDYAGRLASVLAQPSGRLDLFAYDALGRRVREVRQTGGASTEVRYHYLGTDVIEEQDDTGGPLREHFVGPSAQVSLAAGVLHVLHMDPRGHVVAASDSAGALAERYEYGDHGQRFVRSPGGQLLSSSAIGNVVGYHGLRFDALARLWTDGAGTAFDPGVGRSLNGVFGLRNRVTRLPDPERPPWPAPGLRGTTVEPLIGPSGFVIEHEPSDEDTSDFSANASVWQGWRNVALGVVIASEPSDEDTSDLTWQEGDDQPWGYPLPVLRPTGGLAAHRFAADETRIISPRPCSCGLCSIAPGSAGARPSVISPRDPASGYPNLAPLEVRVPVEHAGGMPDIGWPPPESGHWLRAAGITNLPWLNGTWGIRSRSGALAAPASPLPSALVLGRMPEIPWPPNEDGSWLTANGVTNLPWLNGTWGYASRGLAIMKPWDEDTQEMPALSPILHGLR